MKLRIVAAIALIVVGIGAIAFVIIGPSFGSSPTQYLTAQATVTNVTNEVVGSGSIAPHAEYDLAFGVEPALASSSTSAAAGSGTSALTWPVETVDVSVGQKVKKGDVLATADAADALLQLAIDKATLTAAQAKLKTDEAGATDAQIASAKNAVRSARVAVANAGTNASQTSQSNALSLQTAKNQLADAQQALADAKAGPTSSDIANAQDQVDSAQRAYDQAVQGQADTKATNDLSITAAQKAIDDANAAAIAARQKWVNDYGLGASDAQLTADQSAIDAAEKAVTNAQTQLASTKLKVDQGNAQAATSVANAQAALDKAKRDYATNTTPSQTAVAAAQQKVRDAQLSLKSAQERVTAANQQSQQSATQAGLQLESALASYSNTTTPVEATIASDLVSVENAKAAVVESKKTVARSTIVAPQDGTVITVNIVEGMPAPSGSAIVMDVGPYEVTADFSETSLAKLSVGQTADVTVTATGTTTPGKVTIIGATPATGGTSSVVTYPVTVALDEEPAGVQVGMTAEVAIIIAQAQDVVAVPTQALVGNSSSGYQVRVMDANGSITFVPVTVGLVTTSLAEIQSGLSGGETVVTGTVSSTSSTTTTNRNGSLLGGGFDLGGPPGGQPPTQQRNFNGGGTNP